MITIAICDDEPNIRAYLSSLVKKQNMECEITGYKEYVFDAFDVEAFQYLLKPIDTQKFAEVFHRAAKQILAVQEQQKRNLVIQYNNDQKETRRHVFLDGMDYEGELFSPMEALSPSQRELAKKVYFEEWKITDIARDLIVRAVK